MRLYFLLWGVNVNDGLTWQTLGYIVGAAGIGIGFYWRAAAQFAGQREFDEYKVQAEKDKNELKRKIEDLEKHPMTCPVAVNYVSKESLFQQLKPIHDEQAHRARSFDKLGNAFVELQKAVHKMDRNLVAVATHLKVALDKDEPEPDAT